MEAYSSIYLGCGYTIGEIGIIRLTICAKAEGEVEPTMPDILPVPLIEYIKCDR
jgi:hypothetical protein